MASIMPMMIAALIAGVPTVVSAQEAAPPARLEAERIHLRWVVSVELGPAQQAFVELLRSAERPGGMVTVSGCGEPRRSFLDATAQSSLASALDRLTAVYPEYYWTVQDGVINVLPKQNQPPVMDVHIQRFEWDTTASVHLTLSQVFDLAAVKSRLANLGIAAGLEFGPGLQRPPRLINGIPEPPPKGQRWKVENLTTLAALNAIAASYGSGFWWYEERTCDGKTTYRVSVR